MLLLMAILDANDQSLVHATWGLFYATAGLVASTIATFVYGWFKGREQEKRWKHEDKKQDERWELEDRQREEDAKPKTFIELATYENDPCRLLFLVFNLGSGSFLIDKLIIRVEAKSTTIAVPPFSPQIVTPGHWVPIEFDQRLILSPYGGSTPSEEAYGIIVIKGATGLPLEVKSDWFHVFYANPSRPDIFLWEMGRSGLPPGTVSQQPRILPSPPD
jgi:hypothetical protein